jgi:hypothetical protein
MDLGFTTKTPKFDQTQEKLGFCSYTLIKWINPKFHTINLLPDTRVLHKTLPITKALNKFLGLSITPKN